MKRILTVLVALVFGSLTAATYAQDHRRGGERTAHGQQGRHGVITVDRSIDRGSHYDPRYHRQPRVIVVERPVYRAPVVVVKRPVYRYRHYDRYPRVVVIQRPAHRYEYWPVYDDYYYAVRCDGIGIGTVLGVIAGAVIGNEVGDGIGAVVGGVAGAVIGSEIDRDRYCR